jgi:parallel beta-helix repeat protein
VNGESGFSLAAASESQVLENRSVDNVLYGFVLGAESNGNIVSRNQAFRNGFENIALVGAMNNEVVGNLTRESDFEGISLYFGSDHNLVKGNVIIGNAASGVLVFASSENTIAGNRVTMNNQNLHEGSAGIAVVEGSSFNNVVRNVACLNGIVDAYDDHSGVGNQWSANLFCTSDI